MSNELLDRARAGDSAAFAALVDPHKTELQVHCYRMLGSLQDAEDALQETLLAAWVGIAGFEGRSSLRTWLYRIATHRCLNALRSASRRPVLAAPGAPPSEPSGAGEVFWLQPYPDLMLDGLPDEAPGPEAVYEANEAISLAFVTALQLLPPNQRAVLLLRDVLGYSAKESAELLGLSEDAITSALKRARAAVRAGRKPDDASPMPRSSADERELLDRFVAAFTSGDVDALVALFTDDIWVRMPPLPFEYQGRDAARRFLTAISPHRTALARMVPVRANRQPAWGEYVRDPATGGLHLVGVLVAVVSGDRIRELTHFETTVASSFGLPRTLDA
jgi:RNA polymerase sigma-70 factor (TIGR02960 family)